MSYLFLYYLAVNILGLVTMGVDKFKAERHLWRISEAMLLGIALFGGALGSYLGMHFFHHKTKHWKFTVLIPLFFVVHLILIVLLCFEGATL